MMLNKKHVYGAGDDSGTSGHTSGGTPRNCVTLESVWASFYWPTPPGQPNSITFTWRECSGAMNSLTLYATSGHVMTRTLNRCVVAGSITRSNSRGNWTTGSSICGNWDGTESNNMIDALQGPHTNVNKCNVYDGQYLDFVVMTNETGEVMELQIFDYMNMEDIPGYVEGSCDYFHYPRTGMWYKINADSQIVDFGYCDLPPEEPTF